MTPGAPSPGGYNPHTPGSNIEQGSSDWVTTDILVRVKDSFMDLMGHIGVIRSITVHGPFLDWVFHVLSAALYSLCPHFHILTALCYTHGH